MGSLRKIKTTMTISRKIHLDFQHSVLYGALLGDAYLYPKKGIIQLEQSVSHQDYLFWLFENLKSITTGKSPSLVTRFDKRTGNKLKVTDSTQELSFMNGDHYFINKMV